MSRSVVTGASTGIGFATAVRLAHEGHEVHASVRSLESGQPLLEAAPSVSLVVMDVDDDKSVASAFDTLLSEHGPIDVLINNAGIAGGGAVEETPISEFQRLMNTNAWGTLRCIHAVLPSMRERRSGHIINVTSLAGRIAQGGTAAYVASKFATEGMTEVLAIEMRPFGVRVSAIEPGVVKTPIFTKGRGPQTENSPYVGARRMGEVFKSTLQADPASPEFVADAIWQVITSDDPTLRHLVGADAERLAAHRDDLSDEQWIERQAEPDDDVFRSWIGTASGITVTP